MVKTLYTNITAVAMRCSWRSIDKASGAEFKSKDVSFGCDNEYFLKIGRLASYILFVDRNVCEVRRLKGRQYFWQYPRVFITEHYQSQKCEDMRENCEDYQRRRAMGGCKDVVKSGSYYNS